MRDAAPCWIFWSETLRLFWTVNNLNEKSMVFVRPFNKKCAAVLFNCLFN